MTADRRLVTSLAARLTGTALLLAAGVWLSAAWVVPVLYGSRYADAVPAFRILLVAFPLMALNYALTHQLLGWHGQNAYALICAAALVLNVSLNVQLIPAQGIAGAAWATVYTEALLSLGCIAALAKRRTPSTFGPLPEGTLV